MFLKCTPNKKTGRIHLSMAHSYREKGEKYPKTKSIESFGYLDELKKIYDDPIAHFEKYVADCNLKEKQEAAEYTIVAKKNQRLKENTSNRKNYGYIIIMKLFYMLGLDQFIINRQHRSTKIKCNTSAIMKLLVISRILSPGSKKKAFEEKGRYFDFEKEDAFKLVDIYRSLSFFAKLAKDIQLLIHNRIMKNFGRDLSLIYYDVTNYYFEIDKEDNIRKKGVSKEHRPDPIVQMGLAMDAEGLPISYELFPGNESEKLHLRPMVRELLSKFESGKLIAVADAAQNTGNNIYYLDKGKQGYVFSQSIRGGSKKFKEYVLDPKGYAWFGKEYMRKSSVVRRVIKVEFTRQDGTTHKKDVTVDQRQIIFYSEKYATRARSKRASAIAKAQKIIKNPSAYTKAMSHGALKYINNVEVDKETGEIKEAKDTVLSFNWDQVAEDEKYDGYYAIVTNVFNDGENKGKFDDDKIIEIYRGLWLIEDSFRISKHELETRPMYLSREDRINAHVLICYIALVILRLIQKLTEHKHSTAKLAEAMNEISCSYEGGNLFLFDRRSEVIDDLGRAFEIDFSMQRLTRGDIKKNIGAVKKS